MGSNKTLLGVFEAQVGQLVEGELCVSLWTTAVDCMRVEDPEEDLRKTVEMPAVDDLTVTREVPVIDDDLVFSRLGAA